MNLAASLFLTSLSASRLSCIIPEVILRPSLVNGFPLRNCIVMLDVAKSTSVTNCAKNKAFVSLANRSSTPESLILKYLLGVNLIGLNSSSVWKTEQGTPWPPIGVF